MHFFFHPTVLWEITVIENDSGAHLEKTDHLNMHSCYLAHFIQSYMEPFIKRWFCFSNSSAIIFETCTLTCYFRISDSVLEIFRTFCGESQSISHIYLYLFINTERREKEFQKLNSKYGKGRLQNPNKKKSTKIKL